MCLVFFSYNCTPGYRLVLAANRDEFLDRPTAPLGYFAGGRTILAGRDLQGGGTWLGVSHSGKLAAITNYRDPACLKSSAPSRGEIIPEYLQSEHSAQHFLQEFVTGANIYNGFNLLVADTEGMYYFSNIDGGIVRLTPGVYGLSNHFLDSPWPKVVRGKTRFGAILEQQQEVDHRQLFTLLEDKERPPDEELPDTGVGVAWERLLSSIFIQGSTYGTRSSAVIDVRDDGETTFTERTFIHTGGVRETGRQRFILDPGRALSRVNP